jgi:hypothetical protein
MGKTAVLDDGDERFVVLKKGRPFSKLWIGRNSSKRIQIE